MKKVIYCSFYISWKIKINLTSIQLGPKYVKGVYAPGPGVPSKCLYTIDYLGDFENTFDLLALSLESTYFPSGFKSD